MSGGFGSLPSFASDDDRSVLSPALQGWLQDQQAQGQSAPVIPQAVDSGLVQRGLPSMSSVLNGMMSGATGDAQTVGGLGGRIGSMLGDMVGRTGDLIGKFRDGQISPTEFMGAVAKRAGGAAYDGAMAGPNFSQQFLAGQIDPGSEAAAGGALNAAASVAGLSSVVPAPRGAVRMFGGAAAHDDPLAALEASLASFKPEAPPSGPRRLDPNAPSWDLYHGSEPGADFQRFDPTRASNPAEQAVFFAPDPETACGYAGRARSGAEAGSRVFRTTVEPGKTGVFDLTHLAETDPAFNARARELTMRDSGATYGPVFDDYMGDFRARRAQDQAIAQQAAQMGYPVHPDPSGNVSFGYGHIGAALERAQAQGLDTAILRGLAEHGGDDQVVALTPGRVRSYYDPSQLLYSGGPSGAVAGLPAFAQPFAAQTAPSDPTRKVRP